jgi:hypothetical protein
LPQHIKKIAKIAALHQKTNKHVRKIAEINTSCHTKVFLTTLKGEQLTENGTKAKN